MRAIRLSPLRHHKSSRTCLGAFFSVAFAESRGQQRVSFPTYTSKALIRYRVCATPSPSLRAVSCPSLPTSEHGRPLSPAMSGIDECSFHVLALCRRSEDATKVQEVAKEIANANAAGNTVGPTLVLHLDQATVPPHAAPALGATRCCQLLGRPPSEGGTRTMGQVLLAAATLSSTQELLRSYGSILGDGAVAVADRQTSGKGRGGNEWTSPLGCLMFSALRRLRVASPAQAPFINYLVCLAVTRGVRWALKESGLPALDLRIKWPNDIYAAGVKVAGALIHTTWQGGCFNVIAGIGLNVNNRTPTTCLDELLEQAVLRQSTDSNTLQSSVRLSVSREAVLTGILAALEEVYDTFEQQGFAPLEPEYLATWLHSGQVLDFDDFDPTSTSPTAPGANGVCGGRVTRLTVRGLSPSGFLLAEDASGSRFELTPDGNRLDMMQGLIRRKVQ